MDKNFLVCAAAVLTLSVSLAAQTKTLTGPTQTVTGTIEAIEKSSRQIYLKKPDGNTEVVYVPQEVKRFDALKIGDKITAHRDYFGSGDGPATYSGTTTRAV